MDRVRVIGADDHPVFREGMCRLLQRLMPTADILEAGTMVELLDLARAGPAPDSIFLDLLFPGLVLDRSIRALRDTVEATSIIVVSMVDDQATVDKVMAEGADGFIGKAVSPTDMGEAITAIRNGEFVVRRATSSIKALSTDQTSLSLLTPRRREILRLVVEGKSNKEIARALDISPFTARFHVSALMRTLGVTTRAAAVAKALEAGF